MQNPGADIGTREIVLRQKFVDVAGEVLEDDLGDIARKDDAKTLFRNIPAHDVFRVGIKSGTSGENLRSPGLARGAGEQNGGCAIAEQTRRDHIGDRGVVLLKRERAEFDREDGGHLIRISEDVVGRSGNAGGARNASESDNWNAFDGARQVHAVDQTRVDGGGGNASNGGEEDCAEVGSGKTGARESVAERLLA